LPCENCGHKVGGSPDFGYPNELETLKGLQTKNLLPNKRWLDFGGSSEILAWQTIGTLE